MMNIIDVHVPVLTYFIKWDFNGTRPGKYVIFLRFLKKNTVYRFFCQSVYMYLYGMLIFDFYIVVWHANLLFHLNLDGMLIFNFICICMACWSNLPQTFMYGRVSTQ